MTYERCLPSRSTSNYGVDDADGRLLCCVQMVSADAELLQLGCAVPSWVMLRRYRYMIMILRARSLGQAVPRCAILETLNPRCDTPYCPRHNRLQHRPSAIMQQMNFINDH